MIENIFYIIFAVLALGFLVFIHELGHYFMARRVGMKVEAFSIGFGKAIRKWKRNGVNWQIGWLPFGGYVKIAGMQKEGKKEPSEIKDGFFGKKPIDRIKVALMGPLVNFVFAFLLFIVIWAFGGRSKPFAEHTHRMGWVDKHSELYDFGVRPGDEIASLDGHPFHGYKDLLYLALMGGDKSQIKGYKIDYYNGDKIPFDYTLDTFETASKMGSGFLTIGIEGPASYLIYDRLPDGSENPLSSGSSMLASGI